MIAIVSCFVCLCTLGDDLSLRQDIILDAGGFEKDALGERPRGWTEFRGSPTVDVVDRGARSRRSVRGRRSRAPKMATLSRRFPAQKHVLIEFSFAFSAGDGRSLNVWTRAPNGDDASQMNLCVQDGALMQFDGRTGTWETITRSITPTTNPAEPVWHRLRAVLSSAHDAIDYWVSDPTTQQFPKQPVTMAVYRTELDIGSVDLVSGTRIAPDAWYLVDNLRVTGGPELPQPHAVAPLPEALTLWKGKQLRGVADIPFLPDVRHRTIHRADPEGYRFLHGPAIVHYQGALYANWANSPTNENGRYETLQGRRSVDGGETWSDVEVIAPELPDEQRHSHGVLYVHNSELWAICARWGAGTLGSKFLGLGGEAFVLDRQTNRWKSRGIVMDNCWPYDQPMRMANGNLITAGQDRDGLPVVAISHGDDLTHWDSVLIPFDPQLKPSYAETTVSVVGRQAIALIRGGRDAAWVSTSDDFGRTWSKARPSKLSMPRSKAYMGVLSTGQLYVISNLGNRDTLVISVGQPGQPTLTQMWRIRDGKSRPPLYPGKGKFRQWSYPYAHEHDGKLYIVYSIGKEDCGLSILPIESLAPR